MDVVAIVFAVIVVVGFVNVHMVVLVAIVVVMMWVPSHQCSLTLLQVLA